MADPKSPPASQSLIEVSPQVIQSPPAAAGPQPERPLYTRTVSVFPNRVTVTGASNSDKSEARTLFPGIAAAAYYPADESPSLLVIVRKTRRSAIKDVKTWVAKWRDRIAALVLWVVFASYMFMRTGVVGRAMNALTGRDAAAEWEGLALLALIAVLLVGAAFMPRTKAWAAGKRIGRPRVQGPARTDVQRLREAGRSWRQVAAELGCSTWAARCAAA